MRRVFLIGTVISTLCAAACATAGPVDPAVQIQADRVITCAAGPDCDQKWSRAVGWLAQNSGWKIQIASDNIIQTFGPRSGDSDPAYVVTKVADADGRYTIDVTASCEAFFGCKPGIYPAKVALMNAIDPPK